jgi:hypothetical protein
MEKEMEKKKPLVKKRFMIVVEGMAPVKLELETWAYDEEEALKQLDNPRLLNLRQRPDIDLPRVRRKKVTIKDALTSLVKLVKNF